MERVGTPHPTGVCGCWWKRNTSFGGKARRELRMPGGSCWAISHTLSVEILLLNSFKNCENSIQMFIWITKIIKENQSKGQRQFAGRQKKIGKPNILGRAALRSNRAHLARPLS